jgi:hypothetical protein
VGSQVGALVGQSPDVMQATQSPETGSQRGRSGAPHCASERHATHRPPVTSQVRSLEQSAGPLQATQISRPVSQIGESDGQAPQVGTQR